MALLGRPGWWWPLVGTLLILVLGCLLTATILVQVMIVAFLAGVDLSDEGGAIFGDPMWEEAAFLLALAALLPATLFTAWVVRGRFDTLSSVAGRVRWGWLARCALLAVPAVILLFVALLALSVVVPAAVEPGHDELGWVGWSRFLVGC